MARNIIQGVHGHRVEINNNTIKIHINILKTAVSKTWDVTSYKVLPKYIAREQLICKKIFTLLIFMKWKIRVKI